MRPSTLIAGLLPMVIAVTARSTLNSIAPSVLEKLRDVPEGWKSTGSPDLDTRMAFKIAVKQPDQGLFERTLFEISDPSSPRYGQHLKRDELKALLRPSEEATDSIMSWLKDSDVDQEEIQDDGEWINFVATIRQAENLLDTRFENYESTIRHGVSKIRTLQYSVPKHLHEHVRMIQPTTRFGQIRAQNNAVHIVEKPEEVIGAAVALANPVDVACNVSITPQCLKDLYNVGNFKASGKNRNLLGVNGFLEQYARYADLALFESTYALYAKGQNFSFQSVNGGKLDQTSTEDSTEANLDIQYTIGLSSPTKNRFYSTAGRGILVPDLDQPTPADNANEPYLEFFTYLSKLPDRDLPTVLSTSYGEDEQSVPAEYAKTVCDMIGHLGSRGVSVLFSSGDTGVGSACQTNDGKNMTRFLPIFPASCPYVTSVGGTYQIPERAISFSSGGFSDLWPRPSYQDNAVKKYLGILGDRWRGLYNPKGRGFPDISAQSYRFHVFEKGVDTLVSGTSASAPAVAGIVALLNSALIDAGKPTLGFLNPWLYRGGFKGLNDIQIGGSRGCTGRSIYSGLPAPFVPYASWNATEGWDPVTGYGTPDFSKLLNLLNVGGYDRIKRGA